MSYKMYKTDTNAVLRFYETAEKNNYSSERAGKPVFDTVLKAEVITPGQAASTLEVEIERSITPIDGSTEKKMRRSKYYNKYKAQVEAHKNDTGEYADDGMPIRSWAQIDRGTAETLIAQGIFTVEALATISDTALNTIGIGARTLREQAKAYMTSREFGIMPSQEAAKFVELQEENKRLVDQIEQLKAELSKAPAMPAVPENKPAKATTPSKKADAAVV